MIETIENKFLRINIAHAGAELQSIWHKEKQQEYLWQGDPGFWPRKSPVLFPVVGKLKDNSFKINGETFSLPQHGFARDKNFTVPDKTGSKITFSLSSDEDTLKIYPFSFELKIHYELKNKLLLVGYKIKNTGNEIMYFSIGAHPGFSCPSTQEEKLTDYYLEFEKEETLDRHLLNDGIFNGETERVMDKQNILELNEDLFKKDAIVFKNIKSTFILLKSRTSDYQLKFTAKGFPYFGIWKKPGATFICLEPWLGLADNHNHSGELKAKEGINLLNAGEMFTAGFSIEI